MKKKQTPYQKFEEKVKGRSEELVKEYIAEVDKAGDKFKKHNKLLTKARNQYNATQIELNKHSRFIVEIREEMDDDKDKKFDVLFNHKFASILDGDKDMLLNKLSELEALNKLLIHVVTEDQKYRSSVNIEKRKPVTNIKWTSENITEFTQLVYGLYHSGHLTNSENEITKLVEDVATVFNLNLTKNWQGNLSKSIHKSDNDYEPKIFKAIESAFKKYMDTQLNKPK